MRKVVKDINTDAVGISSKTGHSFEVCGSRELVSYLERILSEIGAFDRVRELPRVKEALTPYSDHWPFYMQGVPAAHFQDTPSDPIDILYSHTSEDTVDKVDPKGLKDSAIILALALMKIADSEEIPVKHLPLKDIIKVLEEKGIAENLRVEKQWLREILPS